MRTLFETLEFESHYRQEMIDITKPVMTFLQRHKVKEGLLTLQSLKPHVGLIVLEESIDIIRGVGLLFDKIVHMDSESYDLDIQSAKVAMKSILSGTSLSLPIKDGKLTILSYQKIFAFESAGPANFEVNLCVISPSAIDDAVLKLETGKKMKGTDVF